MRERQKSNCLLFFVFVLALLLLSLARVSGQDLPKAVDNQQAIIRISMKLIESVNYRESLILQRETDLSVRETDLSGKELDLTQREKDLIEKENLQKQTEQTLQKLSDSLKAQSLKYKIIGTSALIVTVIAITEGVIIALK
jgi:hypothetical protein